MDSSLLKYVESLEKISQAAAARRLGVSRALYGQWRSGQIDLKGWQILAIKEEFGLSWERVYNLLREQYPSAEIALLMREYWSPARSRKKTKSAAISDVAKKLQELKTRLSGFSKN